jgi:hypothetical protein
MKGSSKKIRNWLTIHTEINTPIIRPKITELKLLARDS